MLNCIKLTQEILARDFARPFPVNAHGCSCIFAAQPTFDFFGLLRV